MISKALPPAPTTGTYFVYTRVSTKEQASSGLSLEAQKEHGRLYFEMLNARREADKLPRLIWGNGDLKEHGAFVDPGASAYKTSLLKRPAGAMLNLRLKAGDHVAFVKLDRGFRNTRDALNVVENWTARGIIVHFIDLGVDVSTPMGRFMITMMAAIAEWESARRGQRVKEAKAAQVARGQVTNQHAGIGYKLKFKRAHIDDDEQAVMAWIRGQREPLEGAPVSYNRIVMKLFSAGFRRRNGSVKAEWNKPTVWNAYKAALELDLPASYELPEVQRRH